MNALPPLPTRITVALTPEIEAAIRAAVDSGDYGSDGEIVREALHDWVEAQQDRLRARDRLRALIQEGIDSGPGIPAEEVFAELHARYAQGT